jgi:aminoglycoside phosphotransferase (APT) family kinase protein
MASDEFPHPLDCLPPQGGHGHVEEWIDGHPLRFSQMMQAPYRRLIAALMGRLHACPLLPADADVAVDGADKARLWTEMEAWAAALPGDWTGLEASRDSGSHVPPSLPVRKALMAEVQWMTQEGVVAPTKSTIIHKDVHALNLLQLPAAAADTNLPLRLIDAEFADVGPSAFDVANFFLECAFVEEDGSWDWERVPTESDQRDFARAYARAHFPGISDAEVEVESEALVAEWARGWGLVAHLWNILWALTTALAEADAGGGGGPDDFDYLGYAVGRWQRYLLEKETLIASTRELA